MSLSQLKVDSTMLVAHISGSKAEKCRAYETKDIELQLRDIPRMQIIFWQMYVTQ